MQRGKEEVRDQTFQNFNLQIGPISMNELKNFNKITVFGNGERISNFIHTHNHITSTSVSTSSLGINVGQ
mgnify:CR=1 FL=1